MCNHNQKTVKLRGKMRKTQPEGWRQQERKNQNKTKHTQKKERETGRA